MISKEELESMYWSEGMSQREIAEEIGVSKATVYYRLKKYNIPLRSISEAKRKTMPEKEELESMYWSEGMSQREIAKEIGVGQATVYDWFKKYDIPVRNPSEAKLIGIKMPSKEELKEMYIDNQMSSYKIADEIGVSYFTVCNWLREYDIPIRNTSEANLVGTKMPSKEELKEMYIDNQMSSYKIADEIGVSYFTVYNWLREYGIPMRSFSDYRGELSSNWQGGISFEPYCSKFNGKFKEAVRLRDNYTCQLCGYEQNGIKLSVHHIHYDKANCYPDVMALCVSCNSKVNFNRDYYESLFENQLISRGLLSWSCDL